MRDKFSLKLELTSSTDTMRSGKWSAFDGIIRMRYGIWSVHQDGTNEMSTQWTADENTGLTLEGWLRENKREFLNYTRVIAEWKSILINDSSHVEVVFGEPDVAFVRAEFSVPLQPQQVFPIFTSRFCTMLTFNKGMENVIKVAQHIVNVSTAAVSPDEVGFMVDPLDDYEEWDHLYNGTEDGSEPSQTMRVDLAKTGIRFMDNVYKWSDELRDVYGKYRRAVDSAGTFYHLAEEMQKIGAIDNDQMMCIENIVSMPSAVLHRMFGPEHPSYWENRWNKEEVAEQWAKGEIREQVPS